MEYMKNESGIAKMKVVKMNKKMIIVFGLCLVMLISFAGCTGPNTEDPTLKRIKDAGVLKVGTCTPFEPMEYVNESGKIVGFDIDLANEIAAHLGVKAEFKDYSNLFDNISVPPDNGSVDILIAAISWNETRSNQVLFSRPYLNAGQIIIVNVSNMDIKSEEDLLNKTIGVQNGTTGMTAALKHTTSSLVKPYTNCELAIPDLLAGKIDAIVVDYPSGVVFIKNHPGLRIVGSPFTNEYYCVAVKKGEKALIDEINDVIIDLKENDGMKTLENKWLSK